MNYYIADLHLFHKNVTGEGLNFDSRPFDTLSEMHRCIKDRWNAKVTNGDTVYILGDVGMPRNIEELIPFVSTLKGHKILIRGNHDKISDIRYRNLYDEICNYKEVTDHIVQEAVKLVLSHYPMLMWKNQYRGTILLYGHVHNGVEEDYFQKCVKELSDLNISERHIGNNKPLHAINVGCMMPWMDYEPRSLKEILKANGIWDI